MLSVLALVGIVMVAAGVVAAIRKRVVLSLVLIVVGAAWGLVFSWLGGPL